MRQIRADTLGQTFVDMLRAQNLADEDVGFVEADGTLLGVVITPAAYRFFLRKVEEAEDVLDRATVADFQASKTGPDD